MSTEPTDGADSLRITTETLNKLVKMPPQRIISNTSGPPNCLRLIGIFKADFMPKYVRGKTL